jgi:hypothetical protein
VLRSDADSSALESAPNRESRSIHECSDAQSGSLLSRTQSTGTRALVKRDLRREAPPSTDFVLGGTSKDAAHCKKRGSTTVREGERM